MILIPKPPQRLLAIKQRPVEKGLILIAADLAQLQDYIDLSQLSDEQLARVQASWPGPFTWIMPARATTPSWLTGQFDTLAVRVTGHPQVQGLCRAFGKPLVSTSANLTGEEPARRVADIGDLLASQLAYILPGEVGGKPTRPKSRTPAPGPSFAHPELGTALFHAGCAMRS